MRATLLTIHIASGSLALLAGPAAMLLPKRRGWHTRLGACYVVLVTVLCTAAIGLAAMRPAIWWLGVIAAVTLAAALTGRQLARRRPPGWLPWHISLMCGSYISLVTALLVVNLGFSNPLAWILPSVIGSPLIARRSYLAGLPPRSPVISADGAASRSSFRVASAFRSPAAVAASTRGWTRRCPASRSSGSTSPPASAGCACVIQGTANIPGAGQERSDLPAGSAGPGHDE